MIDEALSPNEIRQLMVVRSMLDDATQQAQTATALRRLTAVVLLDGVVERATHLVAVHRGVKVTRNTDLDALTDLVKGSLGGAWSSRHSAADVRQMHRARNTAQHEGVQPAAESLLAWADATRSYVRGLVDSAFNIDIHHVALTDAILDEELRTTLELADQHLQDQKDHECVVACGTAVDMAVRSWRSLHGRANRMVSIARSIRNARLRSGDSELEQRIELLELASELDAFSRDRAEAAWFAQVTSTRSELIEPGDGARALAFATMWVIAYEEAAATWVPDRYERSLLKSRLVRVNEEPAYVHSVEEATSTKLVVRVGDVPPADLYHKWMRVTERIASSHTGDSRRWAINENGSAQAGIVESDDIKVLILALQTALTESHSALESDRREAEKLTELGERRRKDFVAAGASEDLPHWVLNLSLEEPEYNPPYVRIEVSELALRGDRPETQSGSFTLMSGLEEHDLIEHAYTDRGGIIVRPALPRDVVRDQLWKIDAPVQAFIAAAKVRVASERERSDVVRAEAQAAILSFERM